MTTISERISNSCRHLIRGARGRGLRRLPAAIVVASTMVGCTSGATPVVSAAPVAPPPTYVVLDAQRGKLLYEAHCVACHTTQAHWRENSIVGAWGNVLVQVDRWQKNAGQNWGAAEIGDVAAYLNAVYYKMPCSTPGCRGNANAGIDQGLRVTQSP